MIQAGRNWRAVELFDSGWSMSKEIFPSSYECDCGQQSHFFENMVKAMKAMSQKKRVRLVDAALEEHIIVFDQGGMVEVIYPKEYGDHDQTQFTSQRG
jgi:hypothetical protein